MDTATSNSSVSMDIGVARPADALSQMVRHLVSHLRPDVRVERREFERIPLPHLLRLLPLDENGDVIRDRETAVVGRDISERGISFFHQQPLPYRRALVTFDHPRAGSFTFEVDIKRCRFQRLGWYESGGRLMRAVELLLPPISQAG